MTRQGEEIAGLPHWRHLALEDVGSTNAEAIRIALSGQEDRLWITARRQLEGRGRRGRRWISETGNLYASLLLIDPAPQRLIGNLPLVAALAVYRALRPLFARFPQALSIKWPNDILVDGAKINGILLESATLPDGRLAVVIGCGINCAHHPQDTLYPTTDLRSCGVDIEPGRLFHSLAHAMVATLDEWDRGRGFPMIRSAWLLAAHGIGEQVTINLPDAALTGIFEDIDPDGYLSLRLPDGCNRRISAGDLFF